MISLYREPFYTFSFAEDRKIDRVHLDGVPPGRRVVVLGRTGAVVPRLDGRHPVHESNAREWPRLRDRDGVREGRGGPASPVRRVDLRRRAAVEDVTPVVSSRRSLSRRNCGQRR